MRDSMGGGGAVAVSMHDLFTYTVEKACVNQCDIRKFLSTVFVMQIIVLRRRLTRLLQTMQHVSHNLHVRLDQQHFQHLYFTR